MSAAQKSKRRKVAIICFAVSAILFTAWTCLGSFGFSSVCIRCGAIQRTVEWQIPLTRLTVFRKSLEQATPVSASLARNGIVGTHEHEWLFAAGRGNGVGCAIGAGRHIDPTMRCQGVATIIDASRQFGETNFSDRIVRLMLDPKTSVAVQHLGVMVPTNGFASASEFQDWLGPQTEYFERMVADFQKQ